MSKSDMTFSRETNGVRGDGTIGALAGAEQIYIIPYGWNDAPWWVDSQVENIRTIQRMIRFLLGNRGLSEQLPIVAGESGPRAGPSQER